MTDSALQPKTAVTAVPNLAKDDDTEGMSYLESLPRRLVTLYLPLFIILVVLLFPFYWMALTSIKPDEQLIDMNTYNPFWVIHPTLKHISKLLFETEYPRWLWNTMYVAAGATTLSIIASVLAAYAIVRLRFKGADAVGVLIFFAYLVPPSILFIPLASVIQAYGLFNSPLSLILVYPTLLIPFSTWLLMGYFKTIPYELEECALIDGAIALADPDQDRAAAGGARPDLGVHLLVYAVLERVHLRADVPAIDAEQDRAGRDRQRIRRWRHLQMGIADGGRAGRLAAAGDPLCVLRRTLRVGDDRRGEGISNLVIPGRMLARRRAREPGISRMNWKRFRICAARACIPE